MKALGFRLISCGVDGPAAKAIAYEWEAQYQNARKNPDGQSLKHYPAGSIGDGFVRFHKTAEWHEKLKRTKEDWERGWKRIAPVFADVPAKSVTFEQIDAWYARLRSLYGDGEAGRALKTWRSLWRVLLAMNLSQVANDPSQAIRKRSVAPRHQVWRAGEIVRLVKQAIRNQDHGLACIIAIAWDTQFSPVDVRTLNTSHLRIRGDQPNSENWDQCEVAFQIERGKTNAAAIGILSRRVQRLVVAYLNSNANLMDEQRPLFQTKGYPPTQNGGRPYISRPYTKDTLANFFCSAAK